jgi:transcriptional regulator with XRE-family HTH domain
VPDEDRNEETGEDRILAASLQALRSLHGWSREELASRAEISKSSVDKYESGKPGDLKVETLKAMLKAFGITLTGWDQLTSVLAGLDSMMKTQAGKTEYPVGGVPASEVAEPDPGPSNDEISLELGRAQARYNQRVLELLSRLKPDG